uniref:Endonuclease V n=1 Tax=Lynx canadensis TaxID=61383 RepID=A0A667IHD0_LYNCA
MKYRELIRLLMSPKGRGRPPPGDREAGRGPHSGSGWPSASWLPRAHSANRLLFTWGAAAGSGLSPVSTLSLVALARCPMSPASPSAPVGFGVACHLGVLTDLPCIGVAKKLLQVDGLENNTQHKEKIGLLRAGGDSFPLTGGSGTVLGMALRSHDHSTKPLYVSVGHKISLEAAVRLTRGCCRFRIPEPVRQVGVCPREAHGMRTREKLSSGRDQPEEGERWSRPKDPHPQRPWGGKEFDARKVSLELGPGRRGPVIEAARMLETCPQGPGCESRPAALWAAPRSWGSPSREQVLACAGSRFSAATGREGRVPGGLPGAFCFRPLPMACAGSALGGWAEEPRPDCREPVHTAQRPGDTWLCPGPAALTSR